MIRKFLDTIAKEKEGFSFGKPWRYNDEALVAILPILRESKLKRDYITYSESTKVKAEDSGSIDTVLLTNNEKKPVFVRAGELFKGKTQERAVVVSRVVMPGETAKISVVCVHATKGINIGAKMEQGGTVPASVQTAILRSRGSVNLQGEAWASVSAFNMSTNKDVSGVPPANTMQPRSNWGLQAYSTDLNDSSMVRGASMAAMSASAAPSDDLKSGMETFSKTMEEIFRSVPKVNWQTGAVLIGFDGVRGIEVFDLPDSWTAVREEVVRKSGEDLSKTDKDNAFEFKASKAKKQATKVINSKFKEWSLFRDDNSHVEAIETDGFTGEATILGKKVIHLTLLKK